MKRFKNEALTDFSEPKNRSLMEDALLKVEGELGKKYPLIIGGTRWKAPEEFKSINPADPDTVVGTFQKADTKAANRAVETAYRVFCHWKYEKPGKRASYLFKMARIMRRRKFELAAWMVYEVGKSWAEADGDVAEAIDFCDFYGREAVRYGGEQPVAQVDRPVRAPERVEQGESRPGRRGVRARRAARGVHALAAR